MLQAERLLTALCQANVAFVVIGGMAAVAQGSAYVTAHLDLCYQRQPHNYQRLSQALQPFQPRLRGALADLPFVLDARTLRGGLNFTLTTKGGASTCWETTRRSRRMPKRRLSRLGVNSSRAHHLQAGRGASERSPAPSRTASPPSSACGVPRGGAVSSQGRCTPLPGRV